MADLTLTAGELVDAARALGAIRGRKFNNPKASYALSRIMVKADKELTTLEEQRVKLCEQHAAKDDEGKAKKLEDGRYDIPDMEAFTKDWNAIRSETVMLPGCRPITVDETEGAGLTPDEFKDLGPFVVE